MVVLSGLEPAVADRREAEVRGLVPRADVLRSGRGLSIARNVALNHVAPDEIVAYVDDDAVIGPTWLDAMRQSWSESGEEVGVVGGPIVPRFLAPRPSWLSDFGVASMSILDLGSESRVLDHPREVLYGANLSVRAAVALDVGGFDPALGPLGEGPGFGDDIDIQHRMDARGFRVWYEPRACVEHLIGPDRLTRRALLERRWRTGQDFGRQRRRPRRTILKELLSTGGAGAAATVVGRSSAGMDRLAYAAQMVGELQARDRAPGRSG